MAYPGAQAGSASKQIIVGIALFSSEILLYIVIRPMLVTIIGDIVTPFQSRLTGLAPLAQQIGYYTEAAWAILVLSTIIMFIILPAFRKEPSQYGF